MTARCVSRVVADIYRGIEFPVDWIDKPEVMGVGMAREVLVSVAALFDEQLRPLAACWRIGHGEEQFVRADVVAPLADGLLDPLERELRAQSLRIGPADLLATLVWAPADLRPEQGAKVHRVVAQAGYKLSMSGWNMPPPDIVRQEDRMLMLTRRADNGLDLPVPSSLAEMRAALGDGVPQLMTVLPGNYAAKSSGWSDQRKMALLFGGLLLAGVVISAIVLRLG